MANAEEERNRMLKIKENEINSMKDNEKGL
jgi:hypothetical protein